MDRNQIIGLVVMMAFITVYFTFFAPEPTPESQPTTKDNQETPSKTASDTPVAQSTDTIVNEISQPTDSVLEARNKQQFGAFSAAATGKQQEIELSNSDLRMVFSTQGAVIKEVELLNYKDWRGEPLLLSTEDFTTFDLLAEHAGKQINLNDFYYTATDKQIADSTQLTFQMNLGNGTWLKQTYTLPPSGFQIAHNFESKGLGNLISKDLTYLWKQKFNRLEMDITDARSRSTVRYSTVGEDVDYLSTRSEELEEETIEEPVKWMAFKQKFFTSAVIAEDQFKTGVITSKVDPNDTTIIKEGTIEGVIPYEKLVAGNLGFRYYFGPNDFDTMKAVAPEFEENVNFGWSVLAWINIHFIRHLFNMLENVFSNYGIVILVMVVIVRIMLSPLTYKSHMSMAKMRVLKPDLDEIKEKHKDDMQAAQKEQMDLYRKVGINPLSGCIPMILQMPILLSLFYFFPNAIELRQEGFLWTDDLSTYDNVLDLPFTIPFYGDHVSLFTLLMTLSTILYTWSNSQVTSVTGPMKSMQYIMPLVFLFFLNSFSAGLTFYYFVSNMSTFGQTFLFRRFIDEDKIKGILEENRKKNANKKKSKFQMKLEEAMKANQEAQKKKKKRK